MQYVCNASVDQQPPVDGLLKHNATDRLGTKQPLLGRPIPEMPASTLLMVRATRYYVYAKCSIDRLHMDS